MKIGELCNRTVVIAKREDPVTEVARLMRDHHVGCVVIVEDRDHVRQPIGIVTDRDLMLTVVADGRNADSTQVGEAMSGELYSATEREDVFDVLQKMRAHGVRRVPVVSEHGALEGIFAFDDLVEWTSEQMLELTRLVQRELHQERHKR